MAVPLRIVRKCSLTNRDESRQEEITFEVDEGLSKG